MAGRISGIGMQPQVPMPEADPAYWAQMQSEQELQQRKREMENAAAVYNQMQRELTTYGRTLDDPQGARLTANTQEGLGPIAAQRKAAGDIAPGPQPGSGDRKRMKVASAVEKWGEEVSQPFIQKHIVDPINAAGDTAAYYLGPHATQSVKNAAELGVTAVGALPGPGDAIQLGDAASDYYDAVMNNDQLGAWKAAGMAGMAMFLPMSAKGAPLDTLDLAKELERQGTPAEEIWKRTARDGKSGWWRAPDGQWRWEIDDSKAKWTNKGQRIASSPDAMTRPMEPLGTLIEHPEYFDAVPTARGAWARVANDGGGSGWFDPNFRSLEVYGSPFHGGVNADRMAVGEKNRQRVMVHEMQHLLDHETGMPTGSNTTDPDLAWVKGHDINQRPDVPQPSPMSTSYNVYRRSSGENLANATDKRMYLSMDERNARFPGKDMDWMPGDQWVRWQDGSIEIPRPGEAPTVIRGPQPEWKGKRPSSASSDDPTVPMAGQPATPVPATNGPRQRRPQGFGGNGGPNADELLSMAMDTPRKVSARGGYVGAPPGINTPEAEDALVADILSRLKSYKGSGTNFYDDFQNAIRDWTSDPKMAQKFANASGHTSNQMSPLPNTTHALKAMNQDAVGYPVKAGLYPNASGKKITEDFASGRMSADPKTGQYTFALLPDEHRPPDFADYAYGGERAVKGRAVHDTWDKEAFGYARNAEGKQNAASDTEHNFMDRIYNKVVHAARRDPELRARLGTGRRTYERAQADLWDIERQKKEKFEVLPAHKIMQENSALTQVAAIPGPSTGISPDLLNAPLDVKNQYTDEMFSAFSDGKGRNAAAAALGMTPPMERGLGQWDGMMEPNRAVRYGIGTVGSGPDKVIDPASKTAMGAVRDWNQIAFGQEGGGITAGRADGATQATANLAPLGSPMRGQSDYLRTFRAVADAFGPDWQYKVVVQPGKNGEAVLKNISYGDYAISNEQFQQLAQKAGMSLSPGGTQIRSTGFNKKGVETFGPIVERDVANDFRMINFGEPSKSPHVPDVWGQVPQFQNPDSYHRLFDDTRNNPKLKGTFDREIIPKLAEVQQVSNKWEADHGIPANTVIDRVRRIITEAGPSWPAALDAAVKKGIIPAFAGAALLGGAANQFGNDGGVQ